MNITNIFYKLKYETNLEINEKLTSEPIRIFIRDYNKNTHFINEYYYIKINRLYYGLNCLKIKFQWPFFKIIEIRQIIRNKIGDKYGT